MRLIDRWDSLLEFTAARYWPALDWRLLKAQALTESNLVTMAKSPVGAAGLLQVMPATFLEAVPKDLRDRSPYDPEASMAAGVCYLKDQFDHFPEILDPLERLWFSLASYNCGRGYVNRALRIYYEKQPHHPESMTWEEVHPHLARAEIRGRRPDFQQVWNYVSRTRERYEELTHGGILSRKAHPIRSEN